LKHSFFLGSASGKIWMELEKALALDDKFEKADEVRKVLGRFGWGWEAGKIGGWDAWKLGSHVYKIRA
jgi:hypothetical protein